jgi:hypothetical protein
MALDILTLSIPPAWSQVARYLGHRETRAWVRSVVADALESSPLRFVPILPLDWHRGTFQPIRTDDGKTYARLDVRGLVSGPFGIYRGGDLIREPERETGFTLAHVPTGRRLASLDRVRSCKRLAEELAPLRMGWHRDDPEKVGGVDVPRVNALVTKYERAARPPEPSGVCAGVGGRRRL